MSGLRLTEGSRGPGASVAVEGAPLTRTQVPYVTGSSVLGMKCADGVVIACDTMGTLGGRGVKGQDVGNGRPVGWGSARPPMQCTRPQCSARLGGPGRGGDELPVG